MLKKFKIFQVIIGLVVLFSVLFQPLHSLEHLSTYFSKANCTHQYSGETTLTHSHHWEKCTVCDFTFCNSVIPEFFSYSLKKQDNFNITFFIFFPKKVSFFSGNPSSLRAPPLV
jgi:hypothetical protein